MGVSCMTGPCSKAYGKGFFKIDTQFFYQAFKMVPSPRGIATRAQAPMPPPLLEALKALFSSHFAFQSL
jgi:hypothetical protein